MKTRIFKLVRRLGIVGVLCVMATFTPAQSASSCIDDEECYHDCWLSCESLVWQSWNLYRQCMDQCTPSCSEC